MAVPDYQSIMLPLLRFVSKQAPETSTREAMGALAVELGLSDAELDELLPSGTQGKFENRVGWAATYMKKACLLESTRRGRYRITDRGRELLATQPALVNVKTLQRFPEFRAFQKLKGTRKKKDDTSTTGNGDHETPSEALEAAY